MSQQTIDPQAFERLGKFRKKVVRLAIIERKSIYETAIACGCTAEKVKRVLKKWRAMSKESSCKAPDRIR
jgi:hypothetical protein